MLTARCNGKKVYAENINDRKLEYFCPYCNEKMILIKPIENIVDHFRHNVESNCLSEPETEEHEKGKKRIYDFLKIIPHNILELEPIRFLSLGFKPDIYIEFDVGPITTRQIAIEYQCSPISRKVFLKRTQRYTMNDIYVCWIFGTKNFYRIDWKSNDKHIIRVCSSEKKAHELYFGNVYYFGNYFFKAKYESYSIIKESEGYTENGYFVPEPFSYTYYYKNLRRLKNWIKIKKPCFECKRNLWKDNNFLVACLNNNNFE